MNYKSNHGLAAARLHPAVVSLEFCWQDAKRWIFESMGEHCKALVSMFWSGQPQIARFAGNVDLGVVVSAPWAPQSESTQCSSVLRMQLIMARSIAQLAQSFPLVMDGALQLLDILTD